MPRRDWRNRLVHWATKCLYSISCNLYTYDHLYLSWFHVPVFFQLYCVGIAYHDTFGIVDIPEMDENICRTPIGKTMGFRWRFFLQPVQWPEENLIEVYHCDRSGQALTLREKHPTWLMIKSLNIQNLTMTTYEHLGYIADEWWLVDDYFGVLTMNIWGY